MTLPSGGATIYFTTSSTIPPGNISVTVNGTASSATATLSIPMTVKSGPPGQLGFAIPLFNELQLAQGTSTKFQNQFISTNSNNPIYSVTLSVTGLPSGVTATVSPELVEAGGFTDTPFTVTLTASSTAPLVQNAQWTLVATPTASVAPSTYNGLLDVTPSSGSAGWSNRTSYISTRATPVSAVYDPVRQVVYSANQVWNQVDVISDQVDGSPRKIIKSIPIQNPQWMDLSVDGSTVWVATGSQVIYGIDTTTLQARRYLMPKLIEQVNSAAQSWSPLQIYSLSDGTILLLSGLYDGGNDGNQCSYGAIWDPKTNALTTVNAPGLWGATARSVDGTRVLVLGLTSFVYDVASHAITASTSSAAVGVPFWATANQDGSRVAVTGTEGFKLFDGNLNEIGFLPGDGAGFVFSRDGATIYEETAALAPIVVIDQINVATQRSISMAPAMTEEFWFAGGSYPWPFAVDNSGMLLGIQTNGIAFDDPVANVKLSSQQPGTPTHMGHMEPFAGPLAGGTQSGGFGNAFSITPDVYYGEVRGSVSNSGNVLALTSPPASVDGPVDVKLLFPDGTEIYNPLFFTYGTKLMDVIVNGSGPGGGIAAELDAFGVLFQEPAKNAVTVGGNTTPVTSGWSQYPTFTGEMTAETLNFTSPSGAPGWADVTYTTPNGSSTLPKSFFYAKSVTDFATSDSPTFVLFDRRRNQVYLSAGNHIDIFSLASNSFVTPLQPPAVGTTKQFEGLALTPDGKYLLATDLTDSSLAVIDPDAPSTAYAVAMPGGGYGVGYSCQTGPLFVAADSLGTAYVVAGGVIGTACGPGGYQATVNIAAKTSSLFGCSAFPVAGYVASAGGGQMIAFGATTASSAMFFDPARRLCIPPPSLPQSTWGAAASADGNVFALAQTFFDPGTTSATGLFATPSVLYPGGVSPYSNGALQNPALNDSGSLYYWAYPKFVDIIDVQRGLRTLRFGLTETVTNTVSPIAIDDSGQRIFLITDKGLTVVDLGNAPLSVGHLSVSSAVAGTQIEIRGSGFEYGISANVGGLPAGLSYMDSETLEMTVPTAKSGPEDLKLTNPDGTTYTLQNAIIIQ